MKLWIFFLIFFLPMHLVFLPHQPVWSSQNPSWTLSEANPSSVISLCDATLNIFGRKNYIFRNAAGMWQSSALLLDSADTCYQGASLLLRLFFLVCMTYGPKSWRISGTYQAIGLEDLRLGILLPGTSITADTLSLQQQAVGGEKEEVVSINSIPNIMFSCVCDSPDQRVGS